MEKETVHLSLRSSATINELFARAGKLRPISSSKNALFQEALDYAFEKPPDWRYLSKAAASYEPSPEAADDPAFVQLRVDEKTWRNVVESIKRAYSPPLTRVRVTLIVKLVLLNFLNAGSLIVEDTKVVSPKTVNNERLSAPEMSALLTTMILKNSKALLDIEQVMLKFMRGDYDYDE